MTYTDKLADEIIAANGLAPGTKKTWKHLGRIPDRYQPGYVAPKRVNVTFSLDPELVEKLPAKKSELVNRLLREELG